MIGMIMTTRDQPEYTIIIFRKNIVSVYVMEKLTKQQLDELSNFFLTKHVECIKIQNRLNLKDDDIPCKLLFNEHFKYFRRMMS